MHNVILSFSNLLPIEAHALSKWSRVGLGKKAILSYDSALIAPFFVR